MRRGGYEEASRPDVAVDPMGDVALGQVQAVGAKRPRQTRIAADEEDEASTPRELQELATPFQGVGAAEGAKHHAGASRKARHHAFRTWRPDRIGEEQHRRQGRASRQRAGRAPQAFDGIRVQWAPTPMTICGKSVAA